MNIPMEVLCCLPRHPLRALVREVVVDCGLRHGGDVTTALRELRAMGFDVSSGTTENGRSAWIEPNGWLKAWAAGTLYWEKNHGEMP